MEEVFAAQPARLKGYYNDFVEEFDAAVDAREDLDLQIKSSVVKKR